MIKFHIPGIVNHLELNIKLIELLKSNPEYFYDDIQIAGIYGSFYCPWNGGRSNGGNFLNIEDKINIVQRVNELGVGIMFTFTNTMIEKRDLYDMYANEDLDIAASNPLNKIIIVSDLLKDYIHEKYPDIKFISSIVSTKNNQSNTQYEICVVSANMNHTDELFSIEDKSRIEILLNSNCVKNCPYEKQHYDNISLVNLSKANEYFMCPFESDSTNNLESMMKSELFVTVEDLYEKYAKAGFNIFKINGRHVTDITVLDYYLYYMVKPEYKNTVKGILWDYVQVFENPDELSSQSLDEEEEDMEQQAVSIENLQEAMLENNTKMKDWVMTQLSKFNSFSMQWVEVLPVNDISTTTIYMLKNSTSTDEKNIYDEYVYNEKTGWELLGRVNIGAVDLDDYYSKSEIDEMLKKGTYTDEEVSTAVNGILN